MIKARALINVRVLALSVLSVLALTSACVAQAPATTTSEPPKPVADAAAGRKLYTSYCARCHGINMINNGTSFDLRAFPKDDRARFERSVTQGLRAMPAWGGTLSGDELSSLWAYISQPRE